MQMDNRITASHRINRQISAVYQQANQQRLLLLGIRTIASHVANASTTKTLVTICITMVPAATSGAVFILLMTRLVRVLSFMTHRSLRTLSWHVTDLLTIVAHTNAVIQRRHSTTHIRTSITIETCVRCGTVTSIIIVRHVLIAVIINVLLRTVTRHVTLFSTSITPSLSVRCTATNAIHIIDNHYKDRSKSFMRDPIQSLSQTE